MKLLTQIFLAFLIIIKIVLGSIFIYWVELDPLFLEGNAIAAEEVQKDPEGTEKPALHVPASQPRPSRLSESNGGQAEGGGQVEADGEGENIVEEEEIDLNFLLKKKDELEKEEEELKKKREELMAIQEEINNKITTLTQLRNEIRADMAKRETVEGRKLKHLIKAYSAMKPQKAASLIEKLNMRFAVELLSNMKGDAVGNILSFVETEKAAKISEQLAKRK